MRICTLVSSYESSAEPTHGLDPYSDPSRWLPDHECELHLIEKATALPTVRALAQRGFDVFINLCDGAAGDDCAGVEVVRELERLGVAFTGVGSACYELPREATKRACRDAGIDAPASLPVSAPDDAERAAALLSFPLIVKHPNSYSSIGLERASRVEDLAALRGQIARMCAAYGGALVEEFISGRELTVLVAEPREGEAAPIVYPPVEFVFPPGETFKHFHLKWIDYSEMSTRPVAEPELSARIAEVAQKVFVGMGMSSYIRIDLRLDAAGHLHVLDVNSYPAMFYAPDCFGSADLILAATPGGHRAFLDHLIDCARRRQQRLRRDSDAQRGPASSYDL